MIHIFIINTQVVDSTFGDKLRAHLKERDDLEYFAFNTSHAGMEAEITKKMIRFFEGERIRFYSCGGSGTVRNIMEASGDYKDMEVAFFPCGATNDFLKVFGQREQHFHDIDNLIDGHVERIDYIRTNKGVALNTVSFGIDTTLSEALDGYQDYDIFGKKVPFFLSYAKSIIKAKPRKLHIKADDTIISKGITEMIVGNGSVLGGGMHFTDHADYADGMADYVMVADAGGVSVMKSIMKMVKNDIIGLREDTINGKAKVFEIKTDDGKPIDFNLDGEIIRGESEWKIEIVKQGMSFVMPKGIGIL